MPALRCCLPALLRIVIRTALSLHFRDAAAQFAIMFGDLLRRSRRSAPSRSVRETAKFNTQLLQRMRASTASAGNTDVLSQPLRRIGIVGGGIGGLALAQFLKLSPSARHLDVTVFERDAAACSRQQGYYLGLQNMGLSALAPITASLPNLQRALGDPANAADCFVMTDAGLNELMEARQPGGVFVDRVELRDALTGGGINIQWDKQVASYSESAGGVRIAFADGSHTDVDFLVGCDGAHSAVRRQYAPKLLYEELPFTNVAGVVPFDSISPRLQALVARGLVRALGPDGHTLLMFRFQQRAHGTRDLTDSGDATTSAKSATGGAAPSLSLGTRAPAAAAGTTATTPAAAPGGTTGTSSHTIALWVLSHPGVRSDWETRYAAGNEAVTDEYSASSHQRLALREAYDERARARFHPDVADAIRATPPDTLFGPRQIYSVQPHTLGSLMDSPTSAATGTNNDTTTGTASGTVAGTSSTSAHSRVVLMGDAAHGTTTHRGLGANTALVDAAQLAAALQAPDWCASVRVFEADMVKRAAGVVRESLQSTRMIHAVGWRAAVRPPILKVVGAMLRLFK